MVGSKCTHFSPQLEATRSTYLASIPPEATPQPYNLRTDVRLLDPGSTLGYAHAMYSKLRDTTARLNIKPKLGLSQTLRLLLGI